MSDNLTYNVKEFAAVTGLSRSTVYELVTSRKLTLDRLGRQALDPSRCGTEDHRLRRAR
jgi:excisionase family DNA binding protein